MATHESIADLRSEARRAVDALDRIDGDDPERAHCEAEHQLLLLAPREVQQAYERVIERCAWWASA